MIYMVELDFRNPEREADWHVWYLSHVSRLIRSVESFTASQRFRCLTDYASPWLAFHEVRGPETFLDPAYKQAGGPTHTGDWGSLHTNWHRNLFDGLPQAPEVAPDQLLAIADKGTQVPPELARRLTWVTNVGLDRSAGDRGIAVLGWEEMRAAYVDLPGLRIYRPFGPKVKK